MNDESKAIAESNAGREYMLAFTFPCEAVGRDLLDIYADHPCDYCSHKVECIEWFASPSSERHGDFAQFQDRHKRGLTNA